jgi:hypothetical protein
MATDACGSTFTLTFADVLMVIVLVYSVTRTWTATDAYGNTATELLMLQIQLLL